MFLGVTQTLVGWFEMFIGNTFSATIFICYGGFIWSYTMIFYPGFAVLEAYTVDGVLQDEFNQAVGMFMIIWSVVTFFFILAALRSSVAILGTLFFTMMSFIMMAAQSMTGANSARIAAGSFQVIAGSFGYWAALAGYVSWSGPRLTVTDTLLPTSHTRSSALPLSTSARRIRREYPRERCQWRYQKQQTRYCWTRHNEMYSEGIAGISGICTIYQ